jgi:transcriptional regulator with XRE-family HTH domain
MKSKDQRFGDFLREKRMRADISLRKLAEDIQLSPAYMSDVENNRRYPLDNEKLAILIEMLHLTPEEQERMYDLAGEARNDVAPDLPEYINEEQIVRTALRRAKEKATTEDWQRFIESLERKDQK